jgi:hypothetical protein
MSMKSRVCALLLFAIAFGYVEASVVVYLRSIYQPMRTAYHPDIDADSLFPLITLEQLRDQGRAYEQQLYVELGRELATLVMLVTVAWAACRSRREWFAMFAFMFGVWDIVYYIVLRLWIGWPASVMDWDILFLLPTIWAGPVLTPVLIAVCLIGASLWLLRGEWIGRPCRLPLICWLGMTAGGIIIVVAFCWDWRNLSAGHLPNPFRWDIYLVGLLGGLAWFFCGVIRSRSRP